MLNSLFQAILDRKYETAKLLIQRGESVFSRSNITFEGDTTQYFLTPLELLEEVNQRFFTGDKIIEYGAFRAFLLEKMRESYMNYSNEAVRGLTFFPIAQGLPPDVSQHYNENPAAPLRPIDEDQLHREISAFELEVYIPEESEEENDVHVNEENHESDVEQYIFDEQADDWPSLGRRLLDDLSQKRYASALRLVNRHASLEEKDNFGRSAFHILIQDPEAPKNLIEAMLDRIALVDANFIADFNRVKATPASIKSLLDKVILNDKDLYDDVIKKIFKPLETMKTSKKTLLEKLHVDLQKALLLEYKLKRSQRLLEREVYASIHSALEYFEDTHRSDLSARRNEVFDSLCESFLNWLPGSSSSSNGVVASRAIQGLLSILKFVREKNVSRQEVHGFLR